MFGRPWPLGRLARARYYFKINTHTPEIRPVQWVCKVMQMKSARETTGNKIASIELANLFKSRGFKPARNQEDITVTFIDNAIYVWGKALCYPEVGSARENMEELNFQCDIVLSMRAACALLCALLAQCKYEDKL